MDLVDFLPKSGLLVLSLRTTSPSVSHIKQRRLLAFSSVPHTTKEVIYALGERHKKPYTPGANLPLETVPSRSLGLPVPADAFRVRELRVRDYVDIGSHSVFLAEIVDELSAGREKQLAHVSGLFATSRIGGAYSLTEI